MAKREKISRHFFLNVFAEAIMKLPTTLRTRKCNLTAQILHTKVLPDYFRVYQEDLDSLSDNIKIALRALPEDTPYRYYFAFIKFGQQLRVTHPLRSVDLSPVINKMQHLQCSSVHIAMTFTHVNPHFGTFSAQPTSIVV
jgi:hypothetical protein